MDLLGESCGSGAVELGIAIQIDCREVGQGEQGGDSGEPIVGQVEGAELAEYLDAVEAGDSAVTAIEQLQLAGLFNIAVANGLVGAGLQAGISQGEITEQLWRCVNGALVEGDLVAVASGQTEDSGCEAERSETFGGFHGQILWF